LIATLAALAVVSPRLAAAQDNSQDRQRSRRWEIPGFDFRKDGAWRVRARQVSQLRRQLLAQGRFGTLNAAVATGSRAPAAAAVTGTQLVPTLLFSYQGIDSAAFMRDTAQYSALLFASEPPPLGNPYTLRTYYEQMSNGVFSMQGQVMGWVRLASAESTYTGQPGTCNGNPTGTTNCNGIFSVASTVSMQNGFREALARVDTGTAGINFAQFDNDGPDLIPNSGDDDGYVDMMMFAHPTQDGACGGATNNHIWAHRFVLVNSTQSDFQDYVTNDLSANAGFGNLRISDYFVQSALGGPGACDVNAIMPIGTAAHEFGHALGLPDLYDTQGPTEGIGRWGLMGSGNFSTPPSPARMEAWSLNELGWVTVAPLTTTGTYSFGAAPTADTAFLVNVQGTNPRGEYFLLENRQASLADTALIANACRVWFQQQNPPPCDGGLLVWHVDGSIMTGGGNALNAGTIHGLAVEEADGARDLWCPGPVPLECNRGDAGDPYPGKTNNTAFSFNTTPAALKNSDGSFVGFSIDSIRQVVPGGRMAFRLRFGPVTSFLATADIVTHLLGPGTPLSVGDTEYLDGIGNNNGSFDVGDFLAWVKTTGAPVTAEVMARLAQAKGGRP
jgi:M6 family metalloprotease-like protein